MKNTKTNNGLETTENEVPYRNNASDYVFLKDVASEKRHAYYYETHCRLRGIELKSQGICKIVVICIQVGNVYPITKNIVWIYLGAGAQPV